MYLWLTFIRAEDSAMSVQSCTVMLTLVFGKLDLLPFMR
jgi:hypothetical protein